MEHNAAVTYNIGYGANVCSLGKQVLQTQLGPVPGLVKPLGQRFPSLLHIVLGLQNKELALDSVAILWQQYILIKLCHFFLY